MSAEERTYLELSRGGRRFAQVLPRPSQGQKELTIRYGRIGDPGQTSTKTYPTADAARAEAQKKSARRRKGLCSRRHGEAEEASCDARAVTSKSIGAPSKPGPVEVRDGLHSLGIFIDDKHCWVGTRTAGCSRQPRGQGPDAVQVPEGGQVPGRG